MGIFSYHNGKSPCILMRLRPLRSKDAQHASMWTTLSPEEAVPENHPLRPVRQMVNEILAELSPQFSKLYARRGRPSIAPEKLLRALLLQIFFSVRSEPMLLEQLRYNLLFRWFVGLGMDDPIWNVSTFSKNRERFLKGEISHKFFERVVEKARGMGLLSDEHFTVDGTLIEAWASHKSFKPKDDQIRTAAVRAGETRKSIFVGAHAATTRTFRLRTRMHVCIAKAKRRRQ